MQIEELLDLLEKKERLDEDLLRVQKMTREQAKMLFDEAAGVIRALLDLKDLLRKKESSDEVHEQILGKIDDAKRWNNFMGKDQTACGHPTLKDGVCFGPHALAPGFMDYRSHRVFVA